jgi:hypothetical protein
VRVILHHPESTLMCRLVFVCSINSAVVKLSRLTKVQPVYRGMRNVQLPEEMHTPDKYNITGGVEFGFLSASTDPEVAKRYVNTNSGLLFKIEFGAMDRGADLSQLSMYPAGVFPRGHL